MPAAQRRRGVNVSRMGGRWPAGRSGLGTIVLALLSAAIASTAGADTPAMALDVRVGTTGIGVDYDLALGQSFSARIGYSGFDYSHSVNSSDVGYDGKLKLSMLSGLFDWYAFNGGFHLTAGVVGNDTQLDVTGKPLAGGGYSINNTFYSSGEVGSLTGQMKFGYTASPYVGLGWGNPVGMGQHLHFLVDIGAIYGGTPNVSLSAACGSAAPAGTPVCTQLQSDVQAERLKLQNDVTLIKWYPVLNLGLAYRF